VKISCCLSISGRRLGLLDDLAELRRVGDREIREHLPVELDVRGLEPRHELVVRQPVCAGACVDPHDPEPAELTLAHLAVAIGVRERALDLLLGVLVVRLLEPEVALGFLEDLAPLLARVNGTLDSGHV
jgi:hypothetical protein